MSADHVYQATLNPTGTPHGSLWEIHVDGIGVTQVVELEHARRQAVDLVAIAHPELDPGRIRVEFVR